MSQENLTANVEEKLLYHFPSENYKQNKGVRKQIHENG